MQNDLKSEDDKTRYGRPTKQELTLEQDALTLLAEEQPFTVHTIPSQLRVAKMYIHRILTEDTHMSKFSARWVDISTPVP